ncbi:MULTISPECIES: YIP1 family protein [unclassified Halomonas]|uniref:YIP1 family protein n=1 Tax=unclassified Halomonas TaxID=2609666 RepID=UPI003CEEBCE5
MKVLSYMKMPFSFHDGWQELKAKPPSIPLLAWCVVLPMSLLPPVMLYFAGTHYGDAFMAGFADREWRFITTILFLAELLTFFIMGWVIHAVVNGTEQLTISYQEAYLLAALAPLPLWASAIALWVPNLLFNALVALAALVVSCCLIYHGLQALCTRKEHDVVTISATYTIMSAGILGWGVLLAVIWAY